MAGKESSKKSFCKGLFRGHLEEDLLFPYPGWDPEEKENLDLLLDAFRKFADRQIDGAAIDLNKEIPRDVIRGLFDIGIMGMIIPEEFGGSGMSQAAYCRVMEEVARRCSSTATLIGGHESLGYKGILLFGTPEQKKEYLPKMVTGELLAAFSLTEPTSGSDAASLQATARHDPERQAWILNGTKRWTTNGGVANLFTVFVRTPDSGPAGRKNPISAFLVPRDLPGVTPGKEEDKLGLKGSSTTDLILENVPVPEANLIGEPGRGFKVAMEILNTGRLSLAACCLGSAKEMIDQAVTFARERTAFGKTISEFEMVQDKIAEMTAGAYAMESMIYATAGLTARPEPIDYSIESAICKVFATETLWSVVNHAVQINGGNGFMKEYPYERFLRDARVNMIFEGTNEILRLFIALSGMDPREKDGGDSKPPESLRSIHPDLRPEAGGIEEVTRDLARSVAAVLKEHGKAIAEREFLQQRISDSVIDLYAMICCVSRTDRLVQEKGPEGASRGMLLCRLFCDGARRRIRNHLGMVSENNDADRRRASEIACADGGYKI